MFVILKVVPDTAFIKNASPKFGLVSKVPPDGLTVIISLFKEPDNDKSWNATFESVFVC